jgi:hypothetical protein
MGVIWSEKMYVGEGVTAMKAQLQADIEDAHVLDYKKAYVVILALNPQNLMELIPVKELAFSYYQDSTLEVVGLAADYGEAVELVRRITEDVFGQQSDTDVRRFFGA